MTGETSTGMTTTEGNSHEVTVAAHVEELQPPKRQPGAPEAESIPKRSDVVEIPIAELRVGLSARSRGENPEHVRVLAENFSRLPPIVVHRETMTVIDGYHRRRAALQLGLERIPVAFFEGSLADAYLESVKLNVAHGRPLTLGEREDAARRISAENPDWSDRRIAEVCGLSPKTVRRVRGTTTVDSPQLKLGRDERRRPADPAAARVKVAEYLEAHPDASLQQAAKATGSSVATVRDVRRRVRNQQDVVPEGLKRRKTAATPGEPRPVTEGESDAAKSSRATAASIRPDFGQWFGARDISNEQWEPYVGTIPVSQTGAYAAEARRRARSWKELAEALERRARA